MKSPLSRLQDAQPVTSIGKHYGRCAAMLPTGSYRSLLQHSCVGSMCLQGCEGTARVLRGCLRGFTRNSWLICMFLNYIHIICPDDAATPNACRDPRMHAETPNAATDLKDLDFDRIWLKGPDFDRIWLKRPDFDRIWLKRPDFDRIWLKRPDFDRIWLKGTRLRSNLAFETL